jgi:hypothetical protein
LNDPLTLLAQPIDFATITAAVDAKLTRGARGRGGRRPYPTVLMVKPLLLQPLYSPSDDALKYQVLDRASFQRFLGLVHSGKVLDAKTMGAWRERLQKQT